MIEYMDGPGSRYQAGVCNIGPAEIRRRRQIGYLGVAAAVALAAALLIVDAPPLTRLLVALPVAGGLSGLIQAHTRFCAGFGLAGLRNFGALGEEVRVEDARQRTIDRRKALLIFGVSAVGGLTVGVLFALLPV